MKQDFQQFLSSSQARCNQLLEALIAAQPTEKAPLVEAMGYSLLNGGKRVRPVLTYATALAVGEINGATDQFACALECMHSYSLIHDDLPAMDDDDLRRGQPTCHIQFDEATAILAGDALQCLAFEIIASSTNLDTQTLLRAIHELSVAAGASGMVMGQSIDLASVDKQLALLELEKMHAYKTGALIEASVVLGALSAGANAAQLEALRTYAKAIGLAFQVQDDIIDVTSDTETLGKNQGSDEEKNKPTYVSLLGLDEAKQKAERLNEEAHRALATFGERLTTYVMSRIILFAAKRN